ncbi:MAG: glycosyltransferase family 39 protein [Candidatus Peregrinibacteria bacterium]
MPAPRRRSFLVITFCICMILLGIGLRSFQYDRVPAHNWSADEYAFTWSGMSLIREGTPTAWSWLPVQNTRFKKETVQWKGNSYPLITPWLDHPPLFSLIPGLAALVGGSRTFFDVELSVIRIPMLVLGTLTLLLLFTLCTKLFDRRTAIIASLLYATSPAVVFLSRLAVAENLIVLLMLSMILCYAAYNEKKRQRYFIAAILCAGFASLAKITGISLIFALSALCLLQKNNRGALIAFAGGMALFGLYFVYGSLFGLSLLWDALLSQADRMKEYFLFKQLIGGDGVPFLDLLPLLGWLLFIPASLSKKPQKMLIIVPLVCYVLTIQLMGAQSHFYGWYHIPVFPLLAIIIGMAFAERTFWQQGIHSLFLVLLLFGWSMHMLLKPGILASQPPSMIAVFLIGTFVVFLLWLFSSTGQSRRMRMLTQSTYGVLFASYLVTNIILTLRLEALT